MKSLIKGKMGKTSPWLVLGIIAVIGLLVFLAWSQVSNKVEGNPSNPTNVQNCPYNTAPVSFASATRLNEGTGVTAISYSVKQSTDNGNTYSAPATNSTSYGVGSKLSYLATATNYIGEKYDYTVGCSGGTITTKLFAFARPSVTVFNSNGDAVTNGTVGGATNQTGIADGTSASLSFKLQGTSLKSTGDMLLVVEGNRSIGKVSVDGTEVSPGTTPISYPTKVTNPADFIFDIPRVDGGISVNHDMQITMLTSQHYNGTLYMTFIAKQWYQDTDGSFKYGVEDSVGTAKTAGVTSVAFLIQQP